jgi:hypothetical protein
VKYLHWRTSLLFLVFLSRFEQRLFARHALRVEGDLLLIHSCLLSVIKVAFEESKSVEVFKSLDLVFNVHILCSVLLLLRAIILLTRLMITALGLCVIAQRYLSLVYLLYKYLMCLLGDHLLKLCFDLNKLAFFSPP